MDENKENETINVLQPQQLTIQAPTTTTTATKSPDKKNTTQKKKQKIIEIQKRNPIKIIPTPILIRQEKIQLQQIKKENTTLKTKLENVEKMMQQWKTNYEIQLHQQQQQQQELILTNKNNTNIINTNIYKIPTSNHFDIITIEDENMEDKNDIDNNSDNEENKNPFNMIKKKLKLKNKNILTPELQQQQMQQQQQHLPLQKIMAEQKKQQQQTKLQKNNTKVQPNNTNTTATTINTTNDNLTSNNSNIINNNNENNNINTNNGNNSNNTTKNSKPPPIHIHQQEINDTINLLKLAKIYDFEIKRIDHNKHSILTNTLIIYKQIKDLLIEVKTQFFTYTPKSMKPKTIILKGLHENEDVDQIKKEIEKHNIIVINIIQIKTKKSIENKIKLPIYLIQCAPDTQMSNLYKINVINYQKIKWEQLKKTDRIMQCFNCQRFGHTASNCNLLYRCVKCNSRHEPGMCSITTKFENTEIYCMNCKQMGHPASFKGCTVYQYTLNKLKQKIATNRNNSKSYQQQQQQQQQSREIPIHKNTYINSNAGTFADIINNNNKNNNNINYNKYNPNHQPQQQNTNQNNNNNNTYNQLELKIENLTITVQQQGEQISALLTLIKQLVD